ncbi:MAG: DUF4230 domain-containing protein [Clostridia bacterium]|nr:DUF4230 domain-containing protein [Clostridia bacterium]
MSNEESRDVKREEVKESKKQKKGKKNIFKILGPKKLKFIVTILIILVIFFAGMVVYHNMTTDKEAKIITKSTLQKIVDISDLSTYEAIYNGITAVASENNPAKMDYYVAYEAKIQAGFDFEELEITVDEENKKVTITIPDIEITDIDVDISSLDYIFKNKKADNSTVSSIAYKACKADVKKASEKEETIHKLAKENAVNVVKALVKPFIEDLDGDYELVVE